MTDKAKQKLELPKGQVRSSEINGRVLNAVLRGDIFEIVRNKEPWGVFLVRRPRTLEEAQELVEKLTKVLTS